MYSVLATKQYKKSYQKIIRSGVSKSLRQDIIDVINELAAGNQLAEHNCDHALKGQLRQYRECHIRPDVLLVYQKRETELVLVLVDIGSHSNLFS